MPARLTAALAVALLAGCGGDDDPEPIRSDTLVVYSSLPRSGGSAAVGRAVAQGQRLALADARGRAGAHRIKLVELDSAEADERDWDPDRVKENAGRAAEDPAAIAYLGELELGASAVSLPVTNEKSVLQVSPTDGLTSLTLPQTGPGAGPERFYPTERRSFLRLVPPDAAQAGALASLALRAGARRVALAHDGGIFGRQLAGAVERALVDRRLEATDVHRIEPDPERAADLGEDLAEDASDAVVYAGIGGDPLRTLTEALAAARLADRPLFAAGPLHRPGALRRARARSLEVTSPIQPADLYPRAGRRILGRLAERHGRPAPVEALYGYESMRVVLEAVRAAGKRAADRRAVIEAARRRGSRGSVLGGYSFDARGDTTRVRVAHYRLDGGRLRYIGPAPGSAR